MDLSEPIDRDDEPMPAIVWDIRRAGRAWEASEAWGRFELTPDKFEMVDGRLFWSHRDRVVLLALLLENVGMDEVLGLGPLDVWQEALREREGLHG